MTTLKITIGQHERLREEARERLAAAERGEDVEGVGDVHTLDLGSYADLARFLSEANLELVRGIAEHDPRSMREAADVVDRDFKQVHENLTTLEALGIIEFEQDGQSKRPVFPYDNITVEIPVHSAGEKDPATA